MELHLSRNIILTTFGKITTEGGLYAQGLGRVPADEKQ